MLPELERLKDFFIMYPRCAIGFSGGVDSSFLLWAGQHLGADIRPYFVKTAFQPAFELADAERISKQLGIALNVIKLDVLASEAVAANPADRCYHCKRMIFLALKEKAGADGCNIIIDGTNASDDASDRPGTRALEELGVRSPLRECGLTKDTIRRLSKEAGLFTWEKPAYACLATRIPTGCVITAEAATRVEAAEDALFALGFSDFRVRVMPDTGARIQAPLSQMETVLAKRKEILTALTPLFSSVTLDLTPRPQEADKQTASAHV